MPQMSTSKGHSSLPTTIEAALQPSKEARIITEPDEPFRIVHVNEGWCRTCGFDAEEVLGQTCKILHGPGTCSQTLSMLKQGLQLKRGLAVQLLNYTKSGRPFMNTLQVAPLYNQSGTVTHYLGVIAARYLDQPGAQAAGAPQAQAHTGSAPQAALVNSAGSGFGSAANLVTGGSLGVGAATASALLPGRGGFGSGEYGSAEGLGRGYAGSSTMDAGASGMDVGGDDPNGDLSSSRVPPFLTKLTEILTVESPEVVTLNADAPSFTIEDPQRFAKEVSAPPLSIPPPPPLPPPLLPPPLLQRARAPLAFARRLSHAPHNPSLCLSARRLAGAPSIL